MNIQENSRRNERQVAERLREVSRLYEQKRTDLYENLQKEYLLKECTFQPKILKVAARPQRQQQQQQQKQTQLPAQGQGQPSPQAYSRTSHTHNAIQERGRPSTSRSQVSENTVRVRRRAASADYDQNDRFRSVAPSARKASTSDVYERLFKQAETRRRSREKKIMESRAAREDYEYKAFQEYERMRRRRPRSVDRPRSNTEPPRAPLFTPSYLPERAEHRKMQRDVLAVEGCTFVPNISRKSREIASKLRQRSPSYKEELVKRAQSRSMSPMRSQRRSVSPQRLPRRPRTISQDFDAEEEIEHAGNVNYGEDSHIEFLSNEITSDSVSAEHHKPQRSSAQVDEEAVPEVVITLDIASFLGRPPTKIEQAPSHGTIQDVMFSNRSDDDEAESDEDDGDYYEEYNRFQQRGQSGQAIIQKNAGFTRSAVNGVQEMMPELESCQGAQLAAEALVDMAQEYNKVAQQREKDLSYQYHELLKREIHVQRVADVERQLEIFQKKSESKRGLRPGLQPRSQSRRQCAHEMARQQDIEQELLRQSSRLSHQASTQSLLPVEFHEVGDDGWVQADFHFYSHRHLDTMEDDGEENIVKTEYIEELNDATPLPSPPPSCQGDNYMGDQAQKKVPHLGQLNSREATQEPRMRRDPYENSMAYRLQASKVEAEKGNDHSDDIAKEEMIASLQRELLVHLQQGSASSVASEDSGYSVEPRSSSGSSVLSSSSFSSSSTKSAALGEPVKPVNKMDQSSLSIEVKSEEKIDVTPSMTQQQQRTTNLQTENLQRAHGDFKDIETQSPTVFYPQTTSENASKTQTIKPLSPRNDNLESGMQKQSRKDTALLKPDETLLNEDKTLLSEDNTCLNDYNHSLNEDKTQSDDNRTLSSGDETKLNEDKTKLNEDTNVLKKESRASLKGGKALVQEDTTSLGASVDPKVRPRHQSLDHHLDHNVDHSAGRRRRSSESHDPTPKQSLPRKKVSFSDFQERKQQQERDSPIDKEGEEEEKEEESANPALPLRSVLHMPKFTWSSKMHRTAKPKGDDPKEQEKIEEMRVDLKEQKCASDGQKPTTLHQKELLAPPRLALSSDESTKKNYSREESLQKNLGPSANKTNEKTLSEGMKHARGQTSSAMAGDSTTFNNKNRQESKTKSHTTDHYAKTPITAKPVSTSPMLEDLKEFGTSLEKHGRMGKPHFCHLSLTTTMLCWTSKRGQTNQIPLQNVIQVISGRQVNKARSWSAYSAMTSQNSKGLAPRRRSATEGHEASAQDSLMPTRGFFFFTIVTDTRDLLLSARTRIQRDQLVEALNLALRINSTNAPVSKDSNSVSARGSRTESIPKSPASPSKASSKSSPKTEPQHKSNAAAKDSVEESSVKPYPPMTPRPMPPSVVV